MPSAFLVADVAGEIVGRTSIRYRLNDFLAGSAAVIESCGRRPDSVVSMGRQAPPRRR